MDENERLAQVLKSWFAAELESAPADDPLHTGSCLEFGELDAAAQSPRAVSAAQWAHVRECRWCWQGIRQALRLNQEEPVKAPVAAQKAPVAAQKAPVDTMWGELPEETRHLLPELRPRVSRPTPAEQPEEEV